MECGLHSMEQEQCGLNMDSLFYSHSKVTKWLLIMWWRGRKIKHSWRIFRYYPGLCWRTYCGELLKFFYISIIGRLRKKCDDPMLFLSTIIEFLTTFYCDFWHASYENDTYWNCRFLGITRDWLSGAEMRWGEGKWRGVNGCPQAESCHTLMNTTWRMWSRILIHTIASKFDPRLPAVQTRLSTVSVNKETE